VLLLFFQLFILLRVVMSVLMSLNGVVVVAVDDVDVAGVMLSPGVVNGGSYGDDDVVAVAVYIDDDDVGVVVGCYCCC